MVAEANIHRHARSRGRRLLLALLGCVLLLAAAPAVGDPPPVGAGFRWSPYGPKRDPGPAYWASIARRMAEHFPGASPRGVWVVCEVDFADRGCMLNFRGRARDRLIRFNWRWRDRTEIALRLFDREKVGVWLQLEPGFADVVELIDIVLARYGHHPSVLGVGVDAEWYRAASEPARGEPIRDADARAWAAAVRRHNPRQRLFLKHWMPEHMPPTEREGIVFVNDAQGFPSLDALVKTFGAWGRRFAPAQVAFQYGYASDQRWWRELADAPKTVGERLLAAIPNTEAVYWVDFTAHKVFPRP